MATGYAVAVVNNADLDSICDELELEVNITDATVQAPYETDTYTNVNALAGQGRVGILITGTTDAAIVTAVAGIASTASIELLSHADVTLDAE